MDVTKLPGFEPGCVDQVVDDSDAGLWRERLRAVGTALTSFVAATRESGSYWRVPEGLVFPGSPGDGLALEVLGDLIAGLLHVATINGVDPDDVLGQALCHHSAETSGDDLTPSIFAFLVHEAAAEVPDEAHASGFVAATDRRSGR